MQALLVEAELIRTYQPRFNVALKDDKSPLYILITNETFPKVLKIRKKTWQKSQQKGTLLGPFPSGYKVREVLRLVRPIFTWCNKGFSEKNNRPCFFYHIDQCPGVCVGKISQEEYQAQITQLVAFLRGKKKEVVASLGEQMTDAITTERFERAATLRDQISMIKDLTLQTRKLHPTLITPMLTRQKNEDQVKYLQKIISSYFSVPKSYPVTRIEGYDVSNTQGTNPAVSQVTFIDGVPDTDEYRLYNIRSLDTPNDYQMMKEALLRRQNHPEWETPNLVVVDGGKGQVRAALSVWRWPCPVIGIAKNPDRLIIPNIDISHIINGTIPKGLTYSIPALAPDHPALKLIQQVRDESHRFAKRQHTRMRLRRMLQ